MDVNDIQANLNPSTVNLLNRVRAMCMELDQFRRENGQVPWPVMNAKARLEESTFWIERWAMEEAAATVRSQQPQIEVPGAGKKLVLPKRTVNGQEG